MKKLKKPPQGVNPFKEERYEWEVEDRFVASRIAMFLGDKQLGLGLDVTWHRNHLRIRKDIPSAIQTKIENAIVTMNSLYKRLPKQEAEDD